MRFTFKDLILTIWFLFSRWAVFPIVIALLLMMASCTQPSGKHPMYPIDTVRVDTTNHHISYSKNWE